jgi:hypothetical protein
MSYQYSQYPQYPIPPQQPQPGSEGPGIIEPPKDPLTPDVPGAYTPVPSYMGSAEIQSMQLAAIAAGKGPADLGVKTSDGPPADYPFLMYNQQTRTTKAAKDEKDKADLAGKGYSEDPFPAEDPNGLTAEMLQALQDLWAKAGDALKKLTLLVEQQQQQMQTAGNILAAGPGPQQQPQQKQYPTPGYPTGD